MTEPDSEHARRLVEARFGDLFEALPDAILVVDRSGSILSVNSMTERMFDYPRDELVGQRVESLLPERFRRAHVRHRADYFANPRTRRMGVGLDLHGRRKDGREFPVDISLAPLSTEAGLLSVSVIRDISARKRLEEELRYASRLKNEFLATMSHELRTPLNVVIGFSEFLYDQKAGPLNDEQREYLGDILASSQDLLRLINDTLDLSKIEAGRMEFMPETVHPKEAIFEVCSALRAMSQAKDVTIEIDAPPRTELVRIDAHRYKQVLNNLISNAVKFSHPGGRVRIRLAYSGRTLRVEVTDQGIGIDPRELPQLFQEFHQLAAGKASPQQGSGLGLALTKRIVELQGGSIEVTSAPGEGSTFAVILPAGTDERGIGVIP